MTITYTRLELVKIICDECGDEETLEIDPDSGTPEEESEWLDELKADGWIYDKESDTHTCPDCVDELKEVLES